MRERGDAAPRVDVNLVGVVGVEGDEGGKVLALVEYAAAVGVLLGEQVTVEAGAMLPAMGTGGFELLLRTWGDEGVAVDLAVRMVQGHPYRLALVLENKDVVHVVEGSQLLVTVGSHLDEVEYSPLRQPGQGLLVLVGVDDDLGHPASRRGRRKRGAGLVGLGGIRDVGGELVLEDDDIVGLAGYLGWEAARLCRAQGAVLGGREEGAVLAVGSKGDPLAQRRVPPELVQPLPPSSGRAFPASSSSKV